jgi:hypothetical protein
MAFRYQSTYIVKTGDDLGSATYWNTKFQDLDLRINLTESYAAQINAQADSVGALGLARINSEIQPVVDTITAQVATLTTTVTNLQNLVVTDQNNIVGQLNALLATAQTLVANLQSLGTIQDGTF